MNIKVPANLLPILCTAFIVGGCSLSQMMKVAKNQKIQISPNPLEVHKDTVSFTLSGELPPKLLKTGAVYSLNTFYKYADGGKEITLDPQAFKAEDYPNNKTAPIDVSQRYSFPYQGELTPGSVEIEGVASKGSKFKKTERLPVAVGIITTSKLVQNSYYTSLADHGYNNQEELVSVVIPDFLFERGKSTLRRSEIRSDKGKQLDAFVATKNVTRTVTITGTHSPEGLERINSSLSEERAKVIEKFYRDEMKKYDYKGLADSIKFILKPVVEDWTSFQEALEGYEGITAEEKEAYINIIQSGGTFEEQEKKMQKEPTYSRVFKDIYPPLRAAKTEILMVKPKKTNDEIAAISKQLVQGEPLADTLSFEELLYSATLTPSLDEKAGIYQAATKMKANWVSHNNLGAIYLQKAVADGGNAEWLEKAKVNIELAAGINPSSPEVNANMATIALLNKNPYEALEYAVKSIRNGANNELRFGVNGVKGACEIYIGQYSSAVGSLATSVTTDVNLFNKGLAQLLNNRYADASDSFNEATKINQNFALAYYGAAVAAARNNLGDDIITNLEKAVQKDPSLKEKAMADLEFSNFNATDAFRNALR